MTICTDIICGFPTETERDFEHTLELCAEYKFPSLFINQFYPRPGTPAAKMQRVPTQEVRWLIWPEEEGEGGGYGLGRGVPCYRTI